jgi:hypothetical protein
MELAVLQAATSINLRTVRWVVGELFDTGRLMVLGRMHTSYVRGGGGGGGANMNSVNGKMGKKWDHRGPKKKKNPKKKPQ